MARTSDGEPSSLSAPDSRSLHSRSARAADQIPSAAEVLQLPLGGYVHSPLKLGIALDLPARLLLDLAPWTDLARPLRQILEAACQPSLDLEKLARLLEDDMFRAVDIASRVRLMAERRQLRPLTADDSAGLDQLTDLLSPLVEEARSLGTMLDVPNAQIDMIEEDCGKTHWRETLQIIVETACQQQSRTREDWLAPLAQGDKNWAQWEAMARHWQLAAPEGYDSLRQYWTLLRDRATASQLLMAKHQRHPETLVPLSQVWLLASGCAWKPRFPLAVEDATAFSQRAPRDCAGSGLLSLLNYAATHEPEEGFRWSTLERLARAECLDAAFVDKCRLPAPVVETVSRRLRPSDLPALTLGARAEQEALEMAALLGVGENYSWLKMQHPQWQPQDRALQIWRHIYNTLPWLETGHLVQLLRQFGRRDLIAQLAGDVNSDLPPALPLRAASCRAAAFVSLAHELSQLPPETVAGIVAGSGMDRDPFYAAPAGTDPTCRLLNFLAQSKDKLKQLYALLDEALLSGATPTAGTAASGVMSARQALAVVKEETQDDYLCPISLDYMDDPVAISMATGQGGEVVRHFSQRHLLEWLRHDPRNPFTREQLLPSTVARMPVDLVHLARIQDWRRRHPAS